MPRSSRIVLLATLAALVLFPPASADEPKPAGGGDHWSFRPVKRPPVPETRNTKHETRNAIDHFILAKLNAKGLSPAKPADERTLIRRVTFDLTGLPPSPEEVEAFVADPSPSAYEKLIDRLLASPAYGERWGRHWLDLVRYCRFVRCSRRGRGGRFADAWRYRDWVVKAINARHALRPVHPHADRGRRSAPAAESATPTASSRPACSRSATGAAATRTRKSC